MRLVALILACLPAPCLAGCVTADDLANGIEVSVEGGFKAIYRGESLGDVTAEVTFVENGNGFSWAYRLDRGLFVIAETITEHEKHAETNGAVIVGGNNGGTIAMSMIPQSDPPKVIAGADWADRVSFRREQDGPSIGPQPVISARLAGKLQVLPEKVVKISGCSYRIAPVETRLEVTGSSNLRYGDAPWADADLEMPEDGSAMLLRRQIYFLDLGFAVVTQESDEFDQVPVIDNGIIGLAKAD